MNEVFQLALSFPSVVYTVLLGVVLVYWSFVMVGAIELGEGSDGVLDGLDVDGAAKGALEGAAKGLAEHLGGDADLDLDVGDGADGHASGLAALMSALKLRKVPVTVAVSLVVAFSWLVSVVAMQIVSRAGLRLSLIEWAVMLGAPVCAVVLASLAVRPLVGIFAPGHATSRTDLMGKTCVVRTGTVTGTFGEGTLEDGGAGLVIRVRVAGQRTLKRGDHALLVDWDPEQDAFVVEPMADMIAPSRK